MQRPQGQATIVGDEAPVERDTFTCFHCQRIVIVQLPGNPTVGAGASVDLGGFCRLCMKHICGPCADQGSCTPFEKRLEREERKAALYRMV
jgi:hypothetical protein